MSKSGQDRFLFWAEVFGALSVFPAVYIPGQNTAVFKHKSIGWEWGLSVGAVLVFVLGVEGWKGVKRAFGLLDDGVEGGREDGDDGLTWGVGQGLQTLTRSFAKSEV